MSITHADFQRDWSERRVSAMSRSGVVAGLLMNALVLAMFQYVSPANPELMQYGHIGLAAWLLTWGTLLKLNHRVAPWIGSVFGLLCCLLYSYNLRLIVESGRTAFELSGACAFLAVSLLFSLLTPLRPTFAGMFAAMYFTLGVWAMWHHEALPKWAMAHGLGIFIAWGFGFFSHRRSVHEAALEWRDLSFAREVQEALLPAPTLRVGNIELKCFQERHQTVCGDWMAVRDMGNGRALALVADATGHGVRAALVAQAVQTLWTDALSSGEPLEPRAWIERVNRALLMLGERRPQTLTLGLAEIIPGRIVYWSAGHVPLHIRTTRIDPVTGETRISGMLLVARGNPLGLYQGLLLEPATFIAPPDTGVEALLGSDGVFVNGTLYNQRRILRVFDRLAADGGEKLLRSVPAEDDKSLIYVKVA